MNWKPLKNFEGIYVINEYGKLKNVSLKRGRKKGLMIRHIQEGKRSNIKSREYYKLRKNGVNHTIYVHKAVASTFIPNPDNLPQVNHKDGNPLNNHVSNLEWCTAKQNVIHAFENKLINTQKEVLQFDRSGNFVNKYPSESKACREIGVSQGKVGRAIKRKGLCKNYRWEYKVNA